MTTRSWLATARATLARIIAPRPIAETEKPQDAPRARMVISQQTVDNLKRRVAPADWAPFKPAVPPPFVVPKDGPTLAMDDAIPQYSQWAGGWAATAYAEGAIFLGYPTLSIMAQRVEYQKAVGKLAEEITRLWIEFEAAGKDKADADKSERIKAIVDEMDRLHVRDVFKLALAQDGYFGRGHIYLDTGDGDDPAEMTQDIGDGRNKISVTKVGKDHPLRRMKAIEAVWTYPLAYNANNPLADDWYEPTTWYVLGKPIHSSRLLTIISRPVPDLLKPAYSFGGLSLTQLIKVYVDNFDRTRQSVTDITNGFSQFVIKTSMADSLKADGMQMFARAMAFNQMRSNQNLVMIDKDSEEFENVAAPIGGLAELQNQSLEMIPSFASMPIVKYLGMSPSGLNATAEPELRAFYDYVKAQQEAVVRRPLTTVVDMIQLSLFGNIDQDITFKFVPLWSMSEKDEAEIRRSDAETHRIYADVGAIAPAEIRTTIVDDPGSPYVGLDPDDVPDLELEQEQGLVLKPPPKSAE